MSETVGNAAAMREALEKVAVSSEYALKHDDLDCGDLRGFIEEMGQDARAAKTVRRGHGGGAGAEV